MQKVDETIIWNLFKPVIDKLPGEHEDVLPGIKWGSYTKLYTPAFWKLQYLLSEEPKIPGQHRLSATIIEEIVMCILGGYGIPSEMGMLAFKRLKENHLIQRYVCFDNIYQILSSPIQISSTKQVRYRFYNQKTSYVHKFLNRDDLEEIPQKNDLALRSWLLTVDGIGLKTASWITRNWLDSDRVAIIDIHLLRAGKLTGFFGNIEKPNYLQLEKDYLAFCDALQVSAATMDSIIWRYMKINTKLATKILFSN